MGTYGEYIKTRAAQTEANTEIRAHIKLYTKDGRLKVTKMKMGPRGTINYGRAVVMFTSKPNPDMVRLKIKHKPLITILSMDYGLLTRTHGKKTFEQWHYTSKVLAEKKYQSEVGMLKY